VNKYQREWEETIEWANKQADEVMARLKRSGRKQTGLDGDETEFRYIYEEVERRRIDIQRRAKEEQGKKTDTL
jgi:hypothetical protein